MTPTDPVSTDWFSLDWSPWLDLDLDAGALSAFSTDEGLYRVRHPAFDHLVYIGETGRSVRGRVRALARGTYADEMPYRDPHTAAPCLWAVNERHGPQFEVSVATPEVAETKQHRKGTEEALIAVHRREYGTSPVANFGRIIRGYQQSGYSSDGFTGGPLPEGETEPNTEPGVGPLEWINWENPLANDWMGLDWRESESLAEAYQQIPNQPGVYRIWDDETPKPLEYIGECKHTDTVGRPVVQKLHSAIATFDFDGPKRGMVVTTGRFTNPAQEYAQRLRQNDDPYPIELIDGEDLREIADEIGLDLYNGRIEILCDETLRPYDPAASVTAPVEEAFRDIENIAAADLPRPHSQATFRPVVAITADTNAVFETSVGVIHRINDRTRFVVHAERGHPQVADDEVGTLVTENLHSAIDLDMEQFEGVFDEIEERRFGQTQTEYKEWAVERLRDYHTTTVTYTGDNNVTYNKTCEPNLSDISVQSIEPVYVPDVRQTTELGEYSYPYEYYAAGPSRVTIEDGIHRCVHCETGGADETYTYCANCGAIACNSHSKTERLEGKPICTGCAVTERFALKRKYFYDEQNLEAFREEYAEMPIHEKAMENKLLAGGSVVTTLLLIVGLLVIGGII